jgi:hypothetical protein
MRRTRASYHYAIRQIKKDKDVLLRDRLADALIDDLSHNFWTEVKGIRNGKGCSARTVDDFTDESSIAHLIANKYRILYTSVPYAAAELQSILEELDVHMVDGGLSDTDHLCSASDVTAAIWQLNKHKNDGTSSGLSTDHLIQAGHDLAIHITFVFTCMVNHGSASIEFGVSTIFPIPKKHHTTDINNFRGTALSSVFS